MDWILEKRNSSITYIDAEDGVTIAITLIYFMKLETEERFWSCFFLFYPHRPCFNKLRPCGKYLEDGQGVCVTFWGLVALVACFYNELLLGLYFKMESFFFMVNPQEA